MSTDSVQVPDSPAEMQYREEAADEPRADEPHFTKWDRCDRDIAEEAVFSYHKDGAGEVFVCYHHHQLLNKSLTGAGFSILHDDSRFLMVKPSV